MLLPGDAEKARDMGRLERRLVRDNWDSSVAAEKFIGIIKEVGPKLRSLRHPDPFTKHISVMRGGVTALSSAEAEAWVDRKSVV